MENERIICVRDLCTHYQVEARFIHALKEYGLIELIEKNEDEFVELEHLGDLETLMHLHYDLDINMEGIDAISHMLKRMRDLQKELNELRNRVL